MQVNKKGELVNPPVFEISGQERREMKKKLAALRRLLSMFWMIEDCNRIYGCGMSDEDAQECLTNIKQEIIEYESILNLKI